MKKEYRILTDCDGILTIWESAFDQYMNSLGFEMVDESQFMIDKRYGMSESDALNYVNQFNASDSIRTLSAFDESVKYVNLLHRKGFEFTCITNLNQRENREYNLRNLFGNVFDEIICQKPLDSKSEVLSRWKDSGLFWIEDSPKNAYDGYKLGLKSIIVNHPYNINTEKYENILYVNNWKEIYEIVCTEYNV